MSIYAPERVWWKPIDREEKIWMVLAVIWMLVSFLFMPLWHIIGKQNPSGESYKVTTDQYADLAGKFVEKYQVKDEKGEDVTINGVPVVHPPAGGDAYITARMWSWQPVLELEKGKTYRVHMSSLDLQHGFSLYPLNINFMVIPGQDYVITMTPTSSGDFSILCNEYCGLGHHSMVGKLIVKD